MNFTDSPFEQMMKEAPRPGRGSSGPWAGCLYARECKNQKGRCRKKFRALLVEPQASGQHRGVDKPYKNSPRHKIQHRPTSSRHEKRRPPGVTPNTLSSVSNLRP